MIHHFQEYFLLKIISHLLQFLLILNKLKTSSFIEIGLKKNKDDNKAKQTKSWNGQTDKDNIEKTEKKYRNL